MYIDFHTHVKLSKKADFMPEYFREMIQEAQDNGLTAMAMTEHFNTRMFTDIYDYLDNNYSYVEDFYDIDGFRLFPGIEVDVKEIGHILLIGNRKDILAIYKQLIPHKEEEHFIAFRDLLNLAEQYNVLKIGAHPFRKSTPLYHHDIEQLKRLDAFDLNGKDIYTQGEEAYRTKLQPFAEMVGKPIVGGSDTHHFLQYGCVVNRFDVACHTIQQLKSSIQQGQYAIEISPSLPIKVKSAKLVKKYMKQMVELNVHMK
ncbi:PHP domain-containing protein [Metabacillus malikii]|uniref:Metal-dependent phosphoesterase TrpH n=1 Tax=Metabacillus malikii TaxID=1504265 RepID=A0ABT9ZEZ3_9BACI|nr:PHP domain-containing protein [Metabacillus malikii]MDQ0230847.1 putative metal-dependent phosphoesterase TrpH [Metabacillus malikii]